VAAVVVAGQIPSRGLGSRGWRRNTGKGRFSQPPAANSGRAGFLKVLCADASLEAEWQNAEAVVSELSGRLGDLMKLLERRPSETLARRVAELEVNLKEEQNTRDEVAARASQAERKVLRLKQDALGVAIRARPVSRERINAALRELLNGVVIDYRTGHLGFSWRAGGESSVFWKWPEAADGT
jgi:hypothetical protein